jgi:hypothetical protein
MANWCSNSVAFEGNETALEQVKLEFIKMQLEKMKKTADNFPNLFRIKIEVIFLIFYWKMATAFSITKQDGLPILKFYYR